MRSKHSLTFPWTGIKKILEELRSVQTVRTLYEEETGKGFWLVGDQGVYLMPNTSDGCHHKNLKKDEQSLVVYAKECDPTKLAFDTWWETKRRTFGGDDGVEFIDMNDIEKMIANPPNKKAKPYALVLDISPQQFRLEMIWRMV